MIRFPKNTQSFHLVEHSEKLQGWKHFLKFKIQDEVEKSTGDDEDQLKKKKKKFYVKIYIKKAFITQ